MRMLDGYGSVNIARLATMGVAAGVVAMTLVLCFSVALGRPVQVEGFGVKVQVEGVRRSKGEVRCVSEKRGFCG